VLLNKNHELIAHWDVTPIMADLPSAFPTWWLTFIASALGSQLYRYQCASSDSLLDWNKSVSPAQMQLTRRVLLAQAAYSYSSSVKTLRMALQSTLPWFLQKRIQHSLTAGAFQNHKALFVYVHKPQSFCLWRHKHLCGDIICATWLAPNCCWTTCTNASFTHHKWLFPNFFPSLFHLLLYNQP